jgi:hypothetical protein
MKFIILALALFGADLAFAESVKLAVPGEHWSLRFDAPALTIVNEPRATSGHVYSGTAGRLNLSFHVSAPDCAGGDSSENLYKCFGMKLQQIPYIIDGSIAAHEAPSGVPYVAPHTAKIHTLITHGIRNCAKPHNLKARKQCPCGFDSHRPLHF